jgi:hypothetical protein
VVVITSLYKQSQMKCVYLPFRGKLWCSDWLALYIMYMKIVKPGPNSQLTVSISNSFQIYTFFIHSFTHSHIYAVIHSFIHSLISPASVSSGHKQFPAGSRPTVFPRIGTRCVFLLSTLEVYDNLICGCLEILLCWIVIFPSRVVIICIPMHCRMRWQKYKSANARVM